MSEVKDVEVIDAPDGLQMRAGTVNGDPVLEIYTGRLAPMLERHDVEELVDICQQWLEVTR
jgi:hypothetical protein